MKPDDKTRRIEPTEDRGETARIESDPEVDAAGHKKTSPRMGRPIAASDGAFYPRRGQDQHQTSATQRGPDKELFVAGRAYRRAFARFLCDVLDTEHGPKGHRESRPSEPRPRQSGAATDTSRSVTPLLNADTRRPDDGGSNVSPEDIHNTAKQRTSVQARPSFGTPAEPPAPSPARLTML